MLRALLRERFPDHGVTTPHLAARRLTTFTNTAYGSHRLDVLAKVEDPADHTPVRITSAPTPQWQPRPVRRPSTEATFRHRRRKRKEEARATAPRTHRRLPYLRSAARASSTVYQRTPRVQHNIHHGG
eukprot:TRINITY_DN32949_c0_g1_i1.p1 TRINITY_DN32949_c0_g1~~TRINITY_DN32949_c0_g1_i1.p1  ORF type:complete len:128 (-),score=7.32 TRINITY_DN32949_c0_g1_i1:68-451(-)